MPDLGQLNIWTTQQKNHVNGFGCRFVVWVQGCHLACAGCWNQHTWSFAKRNLVSVDELFARIASTDGLDGVTFTGGEPFVQAKNLAKLARRIKHELGLTLQIFTGFELPELNKRHQRELLSLADVVVSGRFDSSKPDNNQKVHQFSAERWAFNNTDVEVEIDKSGKMVLTGYPTDDLIEDLKEAVK